MLAADAPAHQLAHNDEIEASVRAQCLVAHGANLPWAVAGSLLVGLCLVGLQWRVVPTDALLFWLAGLMLALTLRVSIGLGQRRAGNTAAQQPLWLLGYRLSYGVHGSVWGLACLLPMAPGDGRPLIILVVLLMAMAASSFALTAFDLVAALCFGVPTLGLISLQLMLQPQTELRLLALAIVATLAFLALTARRASGMLREHLALRIAEAQHADALRRSEDLQARTGAIAGVGGWVLDSPDEALQLTDQACRIHGLPVGQQPTLAGLLLCYPQEAHAPMLAAFAEASAWGKAFDLSLPLTWTGTGARWVRMIGQPTQVAPGQWQTRGVVQDITQARQAEAALSEKHHLLDLLVHTTQQGYWFVDPQGVTTDANPAMCQILGRPREALIGQSIFAFVDKANQAIFRQEIARRAQGIAGGYEIALTRPDGSQVACFNHATPIFDTAGRRVGSIGMWTDISQRKRTEQALHHTSQQLRLKSEMLDLTLASISQGLTHIDAEGRILVHNRRAIELLDLPPDLLKEGTRFDEVVHFQQARGDLAAGTVSQGPEDLPAPVVTDLLQAPDQYVRQGPKGLMLEVRTRRLPDGGVVRTYADVTDYVQAQRALADREAELRAMLDAFPGFIAVTSGELVYTFVNDRFATLLGLPASQIVGQHIRDVIGPDRARQADLVLQQLNPDKPRTHQSEYEATAHRPRTVLQVTQALGALQPDGKRKVYGFAIDITSRILAEEALTAAKEEAERANQAKSQFLSGMSHELRTPLNAILGFGQLMASDPQQPLSLPQQAHLQQILVGAHHLTDLINDMLDLAVVESGRLQLQTVAVAVTPQLRDSMALMQSLARQGEIRLTLAGQPSGGCAVQADPLRLKQVLINLLSNAIKYNRRGGFVQVRCKDEGGTVCIEVTDSGLGLSPDQCDRLFNAFERLDAQRAGVQGAGLGLALSRRLMQAMGGQIGVHSTPGQGSTFWIRLLAVPAVPETIAGLAAPIALPAASPPLTAPRPKRGTVLYIEDNPVNAMLMEALLDRVPGVTLQLAAEPVEGLRLAHDQPPDLVLLDIQLPGMDGFEVLRRLRADPACSTIPVIAVSANALPGDVQRGLDAGFVGYLAKPLDLPGLLAAIDKALPTPSD